MRNAATELLSGAEFDGGYELQPSGSTGLHECVWRISPNQNNKNGGARRSERHQMTKIYRFDATFVPGLLASSCALTF